LKVRDTKVKNEKWVKRGRGLGHVTYFSKFGTPLISLERLKIQTSNFACGLKVRDTKVRNKKCFKRGRGLGHVTYFSNFEIPLISLERLKIQTSSFACGLKVKDTKPQNVKLAKRGRLVRVHTDSRHNGLNKMIFAVSDM